MAETAAHLVEHVLPEQPIRQWVLSFPFPLRTTPASPSSRGSPSMPAPCAKPMNGTPSNACAATSPAPRCRTNVSRSMTAGRSCIDSSTLSVTGRLMSCSTPSTSCGTSVCRTPSGQPPAVQIGNPADLASPVSPPLEVPLAARARSVPRPRGHLTRYHGVFAPNCKHRHRIIPNPGPQSVRESPAPMRWMQRLGRVFHIDIEHCGV